MTWALFYLICFAVGFMFSVLSFLVNSLHWHLPFGHHGPAVGHMPAGPRIGAGHGSGYVQANVRAAEIAPLNPVTMAAFLAWFGGTGYLLTRYSSVWVFLGLGLAFAAGLVGAGIVFVFLAKVLMSPDETMDPADYEMVGVLGRTSNPIREGGTGEIIYSQAGTRRTCGARSEDGSPIAKGVEVVVTRYENGLAYVRLWKEMAGEDE